MHHYTQDSQEDKENMTIWKLCSAITCKRTQEAVVQLALPNMITAH